MFAVTALKASRRDLGDVDGIIKEAESSLVGEAEKLSSGDILDSWTAKMPVEAMSSYVQVSNGSPSQIYKLKFTV
jgi:hypothetical protein